MLPGETEYRKATAKTTAAAVQDPKLLWREMGRSPGALSDLDCGFELLGREYRVCRRGRLELGRLRGEECFPVEGRGKHRNCVRYDPREG